MNDEPNETDEILDHAIEAEMRVLEGFSRGLVDMVQTCSEVVPQAVLGDALVSAGVFTLVDLHGVRLAAARLRQIAAALEARHGEAKH